MQKIKDRSKTLNAIKKDISRAYHKGSLQTNAEQLCLYLKIGHRLLCFQNLYPDINLFKPAAIELKKEFSHLTAFNERNLRYMRSFAKRYLILKNSVIINGGNLPAQQLSEVFANQEKKPRKHLLQTLLTRLNWFHHRLLIEHIKDNEEYLFYLEKTISCGWTARQLNKQISKKIYRRQGEAMNNFDTALPSGEAILAKKIFRSPYPLDFIEPDKVNNELGLEKELIKHVKKFMAILGEGFAYIGNQQALPVAASYCYLDLLFYNLSLRCYVVIELKADDFIPEYIGKLNFYVNNVDEHIKSRQDNPTIGILLCKTANYDSVRFALKGINSPIGIAQYEFAKTLAV